MSERAHARFAAIGPCCDPPPCWCGFWSPPPVLKFVRTPDFCRGGGEVLMLVLGSIGAGGDRSSKRKATPSLAGSPGSKGKANASLPQVCRMFAPTGKFISLPCKFLQNQFRIYIAVSSEKMAYFSDTWRPKLILRTRRCTEKK